ncbi:thiolase family protein [Candidatus Woesearchaeota archaeon]|nr:thiolase family protein [Candidatus Woesearchaeota archaeon]
MSEREVVVVGAARTPIGKHGGYYRHISAQELAILAGTEALIRTGIAPREWQGSIDKVIVGLQIYPDPDFQQIYTVNVAHGLRVPDAPSYGVQKICGTGFQAIVAAYKDILLGDQAAIAVAGENMTRAPLTNLANRTVQDVWTFEHPSVPNATKERFPARIVSTGSGDAIWLSLEHLAFDTRMSQTANLVGQEAGLTREQTEAYALESHRRAGYAQERQWNRHEPSLDRFDLAAYLAGIAPVDYTDREGNHLVVWRDEGVNTTLTKAMLAAQRTLPGMKLFTPGTSSQISDAGAAMVLMERNYADSLGLSYAYKIAGYAEGTCDPKRMGLAPVSTFRALLDKSGCSMEQIDLVYINEAFAPQVMAVQRLLQIPDNKLNPNGGAIAMGHPLAATGLCLSVDAVYEGLRQNAERMLTTACIGGGQATAILYERVAGRGG